MTPAERIRQIRLDVQANLRTIPSGDLWSAKREAEELANMLEVEYHESQR